MLAASPDKRTRLLEDLIAALTNSLGGQPILKFGRPPTMTDTFLADAPMEIRITRANQQTRFAGTFDLNVTVEYPGERWLKRRCYFKLQNLLFERDAQTRMAALAMVEAIGQFYLPDNIDRVYPPAPTPARVEAVDIVESFRRGLAELFANHVNRDYRLQITTEPQAIVAVERKITILNRYYVKDRHVVHPETAPEATPPPSAD